MTYVEKIEALMELGLTEEEAEAHLEDHEDPDA